MSAPTAAVNVNPIRNVARWTALLVGIGYGYYHRNTLIKVEAKKLETAEQARKAELIREAKEAWLKKKIAESGSTVISDPDDPRFDLETFLNALDAAEKH